MASSWGSSWGEAWGASWGAIQSAVSTIVAVTSGGGRNRRQEPDIAADLLRDDEEIIKYIEHFMSKV